MRFIRYDITSPFMEEVALRDYRPHYGIDFAMPEDTVLRSVGNGVVERVVDFGSDNLGQGVFIKQLNGDTVIYGHMNDIAVDVGDKVIAGMPIGLSGNTGFSSGPHLHLAVKSADGSFIDPTKYADGIQALAGDVVNPLYALHEIAATIPDAVGTLLTLIGG